MKYFGMKVFLSVLFLKLYSFGTLIWFFTYCYCILVAQHMYNTTESLILSSTHISTISYWLIPSHCCNIILGFILFLYAPPPTPTPPCSSVLLSMYPSIYVTRLCPENIFWTIQSFATKLGFGSWVTCLTMNVMSQIVVQYIWVLSSVSRSQWCLYNRNMTVSTILINLVFIVICQSIQWKDWFAVFRVKVAVKIQSFNWCLSIHMNCWIFCNQTRVS